MDGGYRALNELRDSGLVSAIGLGVTNLKFVKRRSSMVTGTVSCSPDVTLYLNRRRSILFCLNRDRNCSIIIGGPYNSGILATGVHGKGPWHYNYAPAPEAIVSKVASLEEICRDFDIPLPAAALQFPLAHPAVVSVIPGIGNVHRIEQTLELFATDIPALFWAALRDRNLLHGDAPVPATHFKATA